MEKGYSKPTAYDYAHAILLIKRVNSYEILSKKPLPSQSLDGTEGRHGLLRSKKIAQDARSELSRPAGVRIKEISEDPELLQEALKCAKERLASLGIANEYLSASVELSLRRLVAYLFTKKLRCEIRYAVDAAICWSFLRSSKLQIHKEYLKLIDELERVTRGWRTKHSEHKIA